MRGRDNIRSSEDGQDIAEYAVMLLFVLILVIGALRLVGTNAKSVFTRAADNLQKQTDPD